MSFHPRAENAHAALSNNGTRSEEYSATDLRLESQAKPEATAVTWEPIVPFETNRLQAFPVQALPFAIGQWVAEEAEMTQTPPCMAALLALASASIPLARKVEVEPVPGWVEPCNLFVVVALEPGSRKSSVFSAALKPIEEEEQRIKERDEPELARKGAKRKALSRRAEALQKQFAKSNDQSILDELAEIELELNSSPPPSRPRLIVSDCTEERVGQLLERNGGRIASISSEGGVFDLMRGKYRSSGTSFDIFLKGHAGDNYSSERVTRDDVSVSRASIVCAYTVQPAVIRGLGENGDLRGRGLLGRFLYAIPKDNIGFRKIDPAQIKEETSQQYHRTIAALFQMTEGVDGEDPTILTLDSEARELLFTWRTDIEATLREGGRLEMMKDWGAKLAGLTVRVAAIMHCCESRLSEKIPAQTLSNAITIADWAIGHAEASLQLMMPVAYWIDLAWMLHKEGIKVAVILGRDQKSMHNVPRYFYGYSWEHSAALMMRAKLVIGNDSAPAHLAGTIGTRTIALLGPTKSTVFAHVPEVETITGKLECTGCHFGNSYRAACDVMCQSLMTITPGDVVKRVTASSVDIRMLSDQNSA